MPKLRAIDQDALDAVVRTNERVLTHAALVECGVPLTTVCKRILRTGPWQRLHPGVVLLHTGTPTRRERLLGALAFAGAGSIITGVSALRVYGVRSLPASEDIHVLVPHERRCQSRPGLLAERTRSLPPARTRSGLALAPPARALVDACRTMSDLSAVRALVADVVQSALCTVDELDAALAAAARQRSALPREVLAEVRAGVRSAAEAQIRALFVRHSLPQPLWNCGLFTTDGEHIATPDGYWVEIAGALQIDSMRWHLSPADYKRTQRSARALVARGIPVLAVAPGDALSDEVGFIREVRGFYAHNSGRMHPADVVLRPAVGSPATPGRADVR